MRETTFGLFMIAMGMLIPGCTNNKEELLYAQPCDTSAVTYSAVIQPILRENCYSCHSTGSSTVPFDLNTYSLVRTRAANGSLWGSVSHNGTFIAMPQNAPKLSDCNLAKIKKWLNDGFPNN
ncbi:MAG: hypothetical protein JWQ27_952 [Ferruginibacter sp.]|nr:hypothetical protein [Ferruginibacter sp.]